MKKSRLMAAVGALTVFVVATALNTLAAHAGIPQQMTAVEALRSIPSGTRIQAFDLTTVTFHGQPPQGLVTTVGGAAGKFAAHRIAKGEILFQADVSKSVERAGLKPGEVGVMVPVDLVAGAEAAPGSRVDVLAGTAASGSGYNAAGKNAKAVAIAAQGLRVVQVVTSSNTPTQSTKQANGSAFSSGNVPAAVELAVPLQEAVTLEQLQYGGEKLTLVLDPWPGQKLPGETVVPGVTGSILPNGTTPARPATPAAAGSTATPATTNRGAAKP